MTTLVKPNTLNFSQLWRSCCEIRRHIRRDTELLDMTRVHSYSSHSYTSLRDVVACSLPAASSKQWSNQLSSFQSLPDTRHVHMRNPLLEKAARAYLATASHSQHARMNSSGNMSSSFSSFLKIIRFPFNSLFGGASTWFKQLYIKI
ncbi:hypothetical protein M758_6G132400 [Ceratodon purpureus]|uniref:Uncharacterized protein n=1 Tax=Ceratodon purpureus TaxID=3225 RepID=A0A8T0HFL3_CERPU|nr:hypothetical protein KC19_6G137900 [Ceratodon purpureus]KAG0613829.1 hypothetical protein M758_6G132400 [Ceratodon purpureus]